ncbi:TolC family outer membrane protein [Sphingomonas sp. FW199]|uniref:TolC family outer membrane protein n=1 Tax=Sphingomonas sp. FW199 TaxID=3400217 RepID=UPI003CF42C99
MRRNLALISASLIALAAPASAETLREAMVRAYQSNPTLTGQRAQLRATDEQVAIARANGLPDIALNGQYSEDFIQANNQFIRPERSLTGQAQVTVPVYLGGQVKNATRAAETRVLSGRATLRGTEADLFTAVVNVYMNVIRDEAIVELNRQNVRALEVNLRATRDRFEVGDLTRTDVAQSEARLQGAIGQLRTAEATLIGSREAYIRVVGTEPGTLEAPPALPGLPADPVEAVRVALENNPNLESARRASDAAGFDVKTARAERNPRVSSFLRGSYFNYLGSLGVPAQESGNAASAGVQLTVPIYQGGGPAASVRRAEALEGVAIEQVTLVERQIVEQSRALFASWQSSLQVIEASEAQVSANRLSLEGVRAENSVGTRTILEILDAERELLNAQVQLVSARRDAYVAGFALLAAMGRAEARDLGLDGGPLYDPEVNYRRVKRSIFDWGTGPSPVPVATPTVNSAPQTPVVTRPLEPELQRDIDSMNPKVDQ